MHAVYVLQALPTPSRTDLNLLNVQLTFRNRASYI